MVTAAEIISSGDRGEQFFDHLPTKGTRRQFSTIGSGRIDALKPSRSLTTIAAKAQESAQMGNLVLERLAQHPAAQGMNEVFDVL